MSIKAIFPPGQTEITVNGLHQWDYGRQLEIHCKDIPDGIIQVHFACIGMEEATVRTCDAVGGVAIAPIPDLCLEQTTPITAWVFEIGEFRGLTTKQINLPIEARTRPSDSPDIPAEEQDSFAELIAAVNSHIGKIQSGEIKAKHAEEATIAQYADADTTKGTIEDRLAAQEAGCALVAKYTLEPGQKTDGSGDYWAAKDIKIGWKATWYTSNFNREPIVGETFHCFVRVMSDMSSFQMTAKILGLYEDKYGPYAEFEAIELLPVTVLIPLMTARFMDNDNVVPLEQIVIGYTDTWGVSNFNRVPVVNEKFQCFGEAADGHFHFTAEITSVSGSSVGFKILDVDPVKRVKSAANADYADHAVHAYKANELKEFMYSTNISGNWDPYGTTAARLNNVFSQLMLTELTTSIKGWFAISVAIRINGTSSDAVGYSALVYLDPSEKTIFRVGDGTTAGSVTFTVDTANNKIEIDGAGDAKPLVRFSYMRVTKGE